MRKIVKTGICCILLFVLCLSLGGCMTYVGYFHNPDNYSTEQHVERITKRAKKRFVDSGEYTDVVVSPLYKEDDTVRYYLLEFEPAGFTVVVVAKTTFYNRIGLYAGAPTDMYMCLDTDYVVPWSRYRLEQEGGTIDDIIYDETYDLYFKKKEQSQGQPQRYCEYADGRYVSYEESPFSVANTGEEKKYAFIHNGCFLPAIKKGDQYLNLISMENFLLDEIGEKWWSQSPVSISIMGIRTSLDHFIKL